MKQPHTLTCTHPDHKGDRDTIVNIDPADLARWKRDTHIQDALPYLTPGQRELLLSNNCDDCWQLMWAEDEDDDEELEVDHTECLVNFGIASLREGCEWPGHAAAVSEAGYCSVCQHMHD